MLRKILFVCFLLANITSWSQLRLIFNESFSWNQRGWITGNNAEYKSVIEKGNLTYTHKSDGFYRWTYNEATLNPHRYFILESSFKVDSSSANYEFGLAWGVQGKRKNIVKIDAEGNMKLWHTDDANVDGTPVAGKTKIKFTDKAYHVIKIKSFSNRCEIYVDEDLCIKTEKQEYKYNDGVGFYFHNIGKTSIDYLKIYQEREDINLAEADFKVTQKQNLGKAVNTTYSEVLPVVSHDGNTLYFTRKDSPSNVGGIKDDIWYSIKDTSNVFSKAKNLGKPVNNSSYNSIMGITADNKTMLVMGKYNAAGNYAGDGFSFVEKNETGWNIPKEIKIKNYYNLNEYVEATVSSDATVILFTIERRTTYGGKDIYFSKKLADGTWSEPANCGSTLNSFADEISPFLAGDNKTLYFASEGHSGYGEADIFMSRRLDDTWTNWSKPVNMGPEINTARWDAYFTVDKKGEWAYMTSTEHSIGGTDIFRFKIPKELKPDSVIAPPVVAFKDTTIAHAVMDSVKIVQHIANVDTAKLHTQVHEKYMATITGKVFNADDKSLIGSSVIVKEIENDSVWYEIPALDGTFKITLEEGFHYDIYASSNGFIAERTNLDLSTIHGTYTEERDLFLQPLAVNQSVVLNNIFFEENKANIRYNSLGELTHVANLMKTHPNMKILIGGHTAYNYANAKFNRKLSDDRAKAVMEALIHMGIPRHRMQHKGYGHDKPLYDINNLWENAKNRRVDFTILEL